MDIYKIITTRVFGFLTSMDTTLTVFLNTVIVVLYKDYQCPSKFLHNWDFNALTLTNVFASQLEFLWGMEQ